jgi:DNA-binding PadR family transcriptional regulator
MSLRHALLGLLAEAPMSGYDLLKRFEHSLSAIWPARHNHIYIELRQLVAQGLITQATQGARGRKAYAITERGLAEVRGWLREESGPVDHSLRFEPLLRANFLWLLEPEEAEAYLIREEAHYRHMYNWLAGQIGTLPESADGSIKARRIAAQAGLRFLEAMAAWAADARREMRPG